MLLNDLLVDKGFDPTQVIVFRHQPQEPQLRKVLPWLAADKPDLFNAYQQTQVPRVEKAMLKARYVASFIGLAKRYSSACTRSALLGRSLARRIGASLLT